MLKKEVTIKRKTGLQARPAALFVQEASRFLADVYIEKDEKKVNAKSIMGLMSLALGQGTVITLITEGKDEAEALETLSAFIETE
ncbi:HPr family phosphocarrier protein [Halalkalibacter akibai]|uniref:Catabolite repression HPr-like protein Crh n=1 Tax=Halalkalibacter akibai (strain ATCC 43226 / DSM 21942 / CIP 109018 / JCM 9157 / 1139) TaxID=1236973 RepID=W4QLZ8_HALA3|nr:HPr family phosphocarrier protein [Halalkalibacter akibai]GAE33116.1 catabolite repression HPr-like protein Crh [Halalkalibacter akibai JCM 9157]